MLLINCCVVAGGLLLLTGGICNFAQVNDPKFIVRQSDFVMSQEDASKFSAEVITPILLEFAKHGEHLRALQLRIRSLVAMLKRQEVFYVSLPAYYPQREFHVVAKVEELHHERYLVAFIPEIMHWRAKLSASDFRYAVLITFAHEVIHLEMKHDLRARSRTEAAMDEAEAWGKTVLDFIRPLEAQNLITVPEYRKLSMRLKAVNDNYADPRWFRTFLAP
jgi:hypothetical protein